MGQEQGRSHRQLSRCAMLVTAILSHCCGLYSLTKHPLDYPPDEFSVTGKLLFSCRQLDSKETYMYLANFLTGCSSPLALRRTGASGQNVGKISFFAIKLSTGEQSATFHDLLE